MFPYPFSFLATAESGLAQLDNGFYMEFDGVDDSIDSEIDTPRPAWNQAVIRTFSFWLKMDVGGGANQGFIGGDKDHASKGRYSLGIGYTSDYLALGYDSYWGTSNCRAISEILDGSGPDGYDIKDGDWHHIVVYCPVISDATRANIANCKMWFDGDPITVTTHVGSSSVRGMASLSIGSSYYSTTQYLDGAIDELAYWNNRELSNDEVLDIYNATDLDTDKCADLNELSGGAPTAWYRMGD